MSFPTDYCEGLQGLQSLAWLRLLFTFGRISSQLKQDLRPLLFGQLPSLLWLLLSAFFLCLLLLRPRPFSLPLRPLVVALV